MEDSTYLTPEKREETMYYSFDELDAYLQQQAINSVKCLLSNLENIPEYIDCCVEAQDLITSLGFVCNRVEFHGEEIYIWIGSVTITPELIKQFKLGREYRLLSNVIKDGFSVRFSCCFDEPEGSTSYRCESFSLSWSAIEEREEKVEELTQELAEDFYKIFVESLQSIQEKVNLIREYWNNDNHVKKYIEENNLKFNLGVTHVL